MYPIDLSGKKGIVFGVANDRSIAWVIARMLADAGAQLAFTYQNDRLKDRVDKLADTLDGAITLPCDASQDQEIADVFEKTAQQFGDISFLIHSIAFANRDDLAGNFSDTDREGFRLALEISAYSLLPLVKHAAPLMKNGGSVIAMTFQASQRVYPGYNVMGTAKAALEHEVRQLAAEFGGQDIRVNAISAGPMRTLAGSAIGDARFVFSWNRDHAPLKRNVLLEEVGSAGLYFASDLSQGVTGEVHYVDGGYNIVGIPAPGRMGG